MGLYLFELPNPRMYCQYFLQIMDKSRRQCPTASTPIHPSGPPDAGEGTKVSSLHAREDGGGGKRKEEEETIWA